MNKQDVVYPFNGIIFSHKKGTDTCYNSDALWKHYAKREKSNIKDHILYYSIFMKRPENANSRRQKVD